MTKTELTTFPANVNPQDNVKAISLKMYRHLEKKYSGLLNPTTFTVYEHIRINASYEDRQYRFNTNHYAFGNFVGLNHEVVKKHLTILCLVGLLRREDAVKKGKKYWFNYFICNEVEQEEIERGNMAAINARLKQSDKGKTKMKKYRSSVADLRNQVAQLTSKVDQLEMEIKALKMERDVYGDKLSGFDSDENW